MRCNACHGERNHWGAWLKVYAKMISGVQGCVLWCFEDMFVAFWSWEKGWKTTVWVGTWGRIEPISFPTWNIPSFAKCMRARVCMEITWFGPFEERAEWVVRMEMQNAWSLGENMCETWLIAWFHLELKHSYATNLAQMQLGVCSTKIHKLDTNRKREDQRTFFMLKATWDEASNNP